jgi:REP element-mobilizing transposase RayT
MRKSRLKLQETAYYHCMSRVIEKRFIMGEREKEYFVNLMRKLAAFSGLRILTYCVMSNHFHILLQVPRRQPVSDRQLLERLRTLYPASRVAQVALELKEYRHAGNHEAAELLKASYTYRMYDISPYFKTLKNEVKAVLEQDGQLSKSQLLRCRVRYFSDGVVLGSKAFADKLFHRNRDWFGTKRKRGAKPIRQATDIGLVTLRDLRSQPISLPSG